MNRRRKVLAAAAFAAPLIVVVAACSFPEVTFSTGQPVNQDGGVDGSTTTSSSSGSTENDGSIPIVLPDGNVIGDEVIDVTPDSGVVVDAAGCDAKCDCDNDGYLKIGCSQLTPADDPDAGKAGGGDCLDTDSNVHPGITKYVKSKPTPPNQGDWNCINGVERSIPQVKANQCTGAPPVTGCAGPGGEVAASPTGCGELADFYECKATATLTCEYQFLEQRIQNCK